MEKQMRVSVERKKPEILSIQELLNRQYSFYVPGYQRGYRWGEEQAKALIKDLRNYYESQVEGKVNSIPPYYLQPIYVKKKSKKEYEVIDGQQRLTTIWLLLYVLNDKKENYVENSFVINYETRNEWYSDFLLYANKVIADDEFEKKNLDFFHIAEVYRIFSQNITKRSTQSPDNIKGEILKDILLNHVKIIWSEVPTNVSNDNINDVIDSFTNINSGKIKLTCAELIKAVFLQQSIYWSIGTKSDESITDPEKRLEQAVRSLFKNTQQANSTRDRIAREWDEIERMLGNDRFWYFIYDKECGQLYDTRIEYIFNLVVGVERGADPMQAFTKIYNELAEKKDADDQLEYITNTWKEVKKYVDTLYNWWMDKEMYHKIGYLICTAPWISTSVKEDEENEKTKEKTKKTSVVSYLMSGLYKEGWSKHKLKEEIRQRIIDTFEFVEKQEDDTYDIPELDESFTYSRRENIRKALLFFNIDTLLKQKGDDRFAFDKYKTESWDIEHIASQTDFNFKDASAKEEWCLALLQYFTGIDINEVTIEEEGKYSKKIRKYCSYPDREKKISECINYLPDRNKKELCNYLFSYLKGEEILDSKQAKQLVEEIFGKDEITDDDKHLIGNLTLLHMSINRGYGNAVFPVKRMKVIQGAEEGYYVPICTQKVFQKAYSRQLDQLYTWTNADFVAYGNAVKKAILDFCNNNNNQ